MRQPGHESWVLRIQCAMFPHALFCALSRWRLVPLRFPLVILTITVAGLAYELQKERDPSAARLANI